MIGVAIERWDWHRILKVEEWLTNTFGKSAETTWHYDQDYDLRDLVMSDEIYVTFLLRWPEWQKW